jgi:hypothetical protein
VTAGVLGTSSQKMNTTIGSRPGKVHEPIETSALDRTHLHVANVAADSH